MQEIRAHSSAWLERFADNEEVPGSSPGTPTEPVQVQVEGWFAVTGTSPERGAREEVACAGSSNRRRPGLPESTGIRSPEGTLEQVDRYGGLAPAPGPEPVNGP